MADLTTQFTQFLADITANGTLTERLGRRAHVALETCVGNSSHATAGGTDDTTALQALVDAAVVDGSGRGLVLIPGNRTYLITDTLDIPFGIEICGIGGRNGAGNAAPPTIVWGGAAGGTMLDVATIHQNIPATVLRNLTITGRSDGTNLPATLLKFRGIEGGQGAPDTGTYIDGCNFQACSGDAIRMEGGATNFWIRSSRWDGVGGYGLYVDLSDGKAFKASMDGHCTYTTETGKGFIFLDGEAATETGSESVLELYSPHIEVGGNLTETYAGGTNPYDRRGVIRLGVSSAQASVQHKLTVIGYKHDKASGAASHSIFQVTATGGTDLANARMVRVIVLGGEGMTSGTTDAGATDEVGFIGGRIPAAERAPRGAVRQGLMIFAIGKDAVGEHIDNWINTRDFTVRGFMPAPSTFANLIPSPWLGSYLVTCTDVPNSLAQGANVTVGGGTNTRPLYWDPKGIDPDNGAWKTLIAT